jgi:FkbM family methyltransferase
MVRPQVDGFTLSDYGVWLKIRKKDVTFRFCRDASYGYYFSDWLDSQREPFVLLDIGANVGLYSLIALKNPFCLHVVGFEPMRETAEYLRTNLTAQGRSEWTVVEAAISAAAGTGVLHVRDGHSGGAMLAPRTEQMSDAPEPGRMQHEVELIGPMQLKEVLAPLPKGRVIAKVDVEGHEADVFETLLVAMSGMLAAAWVEFSPATDIPRTERLLRTAGLKEHARIGRPEHYDGLWLAYA